MQDTFALLINSVNKIAALDDNEIKEIQRCLTERVVKKKEVFLEAGYVCDKMFFVAKGLMRSFHINPNGSEFTRLFVQEGQFCTILISFNNHLKSPASFQALEDSVLLEISEKDFRMLVAKFPSLQKIYLKILEDYQNFHIKRMELLTHRSPKERIKQFTAENHQLSERLSNKMIASYLQISPETFSRFTTNRQN